MSAIYLALNIGLLAVAFLLYTMFVYWFSSKNKRIDVYIQPRIFTWQVKTLLLVLGTVFTLFEASIFFGTIFGPALGVSAQFTLVELIYLSMMLFAVLFGLVIWPIIFIPIPIVAIMISSIGLTGQIIFYGYIFLGMVPIYLSLLASSRQAVDTLILRIKEAGNLSLASHMEEESRIGILGAIAGIILPQALPSRWIRRATKVGALKITLSISTRAHAQGTRVNERYTTVTLEKISNSPKEVRDRIGKVTDQITGESKNF